MLAAKRDVVGKPPSPVRFYVAKPDVAILLGDLDPREPSPLFAGVFKQLTAAADTESPADVEMQVEAARAQPFRDWLNRAALRYAKEGHWTKARAFARVRHSEQPSD
jgi:hypothetical protein